MNAVAQSKDLDVITIDTCVKISNHNSDKDQDMKDE